MCDAMPHHHNGGYVVDHRGRVRFMTIADVLDFVAGHAADLEDVHRARYFLGHETPQPDHIKAYADRTRAQRDKQLSERMTSAAGRPSTSKRANFRDVLRADKRRKPRRH